MTIQTYIVKRQHYGDRAYSIGDLREADPREVRQLVDAGVLEIAAEKAEAKVDNKAMKAPKNKAV